MHFNAIHEIFDFNLCLKQFIEVSLQTHYTLFFFNPRNRHKRTIVILTVFITKVTYDSPQMPEDDAAKYAAMT